MEKSKRHTVPLGRLLIRGIHYEEVSEFTDSVFSDVYERATRMVESIVGENRKKVLNRTESYKERQIEIANAVSFIGRRGTGKTSALLSFREALSRYNGENLPGHQNENIYFDDQANMKQVRFFCLDSIDTAIMEESEDVFILVLAGMLNQMEISASRNKEEKNKYERRSIIMKMESIYDAFMSIKGIRSEAQEEFSSYERLKNMTGSQRIREDFAMLVSDYLRCMLWDKYGRPNETYLVIALDDLDMANYQSMSERGAKQCKKSYEIMRSISKYLSVPGVIVLSAYNHMNLHEQCVRVFDLAGRDGNDENSESDTLATQFMEKVFSPVYRLYMPSWRKRDYAEKRIFVNLGNPDSAAADIFSEYRSRETILSVKELILIMYAEILNVHYDMWGKKTHFLEPDSMRSLNNTIHLLMPPNSEEGARVTIQYKEEDVNLIFRRIKDDIYYRFVDEKLCRASEKALFKRWLGMRIDRRSESIVQHVSPGIPPLGLARKQMAHEWEIEKQMMLDRPDTGDDVQVLQQNIESILDNSNVAYSYAELVHCIYHMTRTGIGSVKETYSRELVACILHSYTIYLSQLYFDYRKAIKNFSLEEYEEYRKYYMGVSDKVSADLREKMRPVKENYELLKGVIGKSVCGRWAEYYFPRCRAMLITDELSEAVILGYQENCIFAYEAKVKNDNEKLKMLVNEWLFMFSLRPDFLEFPELKLNILASERTEDFNISLSGKSGSEFRSDFEVTAFLKHSFLYPEFLRKAEILLNTALEQEKLSCERQQAKSGMNTGKAEIIESLCTAVDDVLKKMWAGYFVWEHNYGSMMIPIYDFDLVYNMLKRMYKDGKKLHSAPLLFDHENTFCSAFQDMMQRFLEHLKEIDRVYCLKAENDKKDESGRIGFATCFSQCPFYEMIQTICGNTDSVENVQRFIVHSVITDIQSTRKYHSTPEPEQDLMK